MKKLIISIVLLCAVASQGATLVQIRNACDIRMTNIFNWLQPKQETYFSNNNRYAQALWTHTFTPADGTNSAPDNTNSAPTSGVSWAFLNTSTITNLPCRLDVDVYQAPDGWGWTLTGEVKVTTNIYRRCMNSGPETWREFYWVKVN